jgi:hypothetical protein
MDGSQGPFAGDSSSSGLLGDQWFLDDVTDVSLSVFLFLDEMMVVFLPHFSYQSHPTFLSFFIPFFLLVRMDLDYNSMELQEVLQNGLLKHSLVWTIWGM